MKSKLIRLKKALFGGMAFVMAATLVSPASAALAAEVETQTEAKETGASAAEAAELRETNLRVANHTAGRSGAMTVKEPVVSDIEAPEAGKPLDDKALVTTAEKEHWEIPVLWVSSSGEVISGTANGSQGISVTAAADREYFPVIAYVVPENYTIANTDGSSGTYMLKLTKEVTKLFGASQVITIYNNNTGITYLLPASLKDLFAAKAKDSSADGSYCSLSDGENDCNCNPNAVSDAYDEGDGEEWEYDGDDSEVSGYGDGENPAEEKPAETELQKLVRIHCNDAAKKVFSQDDLEFFADLIINRLQPQAINLILESFPSLRVEASEGGIGRDVGLEIDYDPDSSYYGYATNNPNIKQGTLSYFISINTAMLVKDKKAANPVVTKGGDNIIELANTMVHEFFHVFMYDYNRTGMIGMTTPTEPTAVNGKETDKYSQVLFPLWFIEGTASAVEHNWRGRPNEFIVLRREFSEDVQYRQFYDRELLLKRYVLGYDQTQDDGSVKNFFTYDLECANGYDKSGHKVDTVGSRYTAGYLATLYLSELSASSHSKIGSSITRTDSGVTFDNERLKYGLDNILNMLHSGKSLDTVIKEISKGDYQSTADFEARFIKGPLTEGYYYGDDKSIEFAVDFMNYMLKISNTEGRNNVANGSILFDFEQDFAIPLDPNKYDTTKTLKVYPYNSYVYSTVNPVYAHTSGGKSVSGTPMSSNNVVPFPGSDSQAGTGNSAAKEAEGVPAPGTEAAKEIADSVDEALVDETVPCVESAEDKTTPEVAPQDEPPSEDKTTPEVAPQDETTSEDKTTPEVAPQDETTSEDKTTPEVAPQDAPSAETEEEVAADGTSSAEVEISSEGKSNETASADTITEN